MEDKTFELMTKMYSEFTEFRKEMNEFKGEMYEFKDDMYEFRKETKNDIIRLENKLDSNCKALLMDIN